jgi:hypothetical protein
MRLGLGILLCVASCWDNIGTGNKIPVPPVHRLPGDVATPVVLLDQDPIIETKDPNHVLRANEQHLPQRYRAAMAEALALAGFRVTERPSDAHDLVARLAIAVTERSEDDITQVYRCGLQASDGAKVAQIDWTWPKGTYVDTYSVLEFATHNVADEVATSRRVLGWLRQRPALAGDGGA